MRYLPLIVLLMLVGQAAPDAAPVELSPADNESDAPASATFDPHPLTESQRIKLETADDTSGTIDEAAFYGLLENAERWSDEEAGAVVPDWDDLRRHPDNWRGKRLLVEGRIKRVITELHLTKSGWERVQGVVLLVNDDLAINDPGMKAHDFVIAYITDPPKWTWWREDQGLPLQHGQRARLVARFYKLTLQETQAAAQNNQSHKISYVALVGKEFTQMVKPGEPQGAAATPLRQLIVPGLLVLAIVAYFLYRINVVRRRFSERPSLRERLEERRGRRDDRDDNDDDDDADIPLPRDPINALDVLSNAHEESEQEKQRERDAVERRLDGSAIAEDHPARRHDDNGNGSGNGDGQAPAYLSDQEDDADDPDDDDQSDPADSDRAQD